MGPYINNSAQWACVEGRYYDNRYFDEWLAGVAKLWGDETAPDKELDIVVDIETLGVAVGSVVYSIALGALITAESSTQLHGVYCGATTWAIEADGTVDLATLKWHVEQRLRATGSVIDSQLAQALVPTEEVLSQEETVDRLKEVVDRFPKGVVHYYSRGKDFDFPHLDAMAERVGKSIGWPFYKIRDLRDMVAAAKMAGFKDMRPTKGNHIAVVDVAAEVNELWQMKKFLYDVRTKDVAVTLHDYDAVSYLVEGAPHSPAIARSKG